MDENKILFHGEMQLMDYGMSRTSGTWVKLWIHDDDLDHFKVMKERTGKQAGQRLGVVIVQIGDDEAVVEHPPAPAPAPVASPAPRPYRKPAVGDLARVAVIWCKSPVFQEWAFHHQGYNGEKGEAGCKEFILMAAGVYDRHPDAPSRKHLDADPECGKAFLDRVLYPFRDYLQKEGLEP